MGRSRAQSGLKSSGTTTPSNPSLVALPLRGKHSAQVDLFVVDVFFHHERIGRTRTASTAARPSVLFLCAYSAHGRTT